MPPHMSGAEGVRIVLAVVGVLLSAYACVYAYQGSMVFAFPIRGRMVLRRRIQMACFLVIFLVIGAQTIAAANTPEPVIITSAGIAGSYAFVVVELILIVVIAIFSLGWAGTHIVVGNNPLQPPADQMVTQASLDAREILHDADNRIAIAVGLASLLLASDEPMTSRVAADLRSLERALMDATAMYDQAHALIRSQTTDIVPPKGV